MDGALILIALLSLAIYIGVIVAATIIASRKGRSAIGWCFLTIIFPIAILFVAIAAPADAHPIRSDAKLNEADKKIIEIAKRNPFYWGFLGIVPYTFYLQGGYFFPETWSILSIYLPTFIYHFLLFWIFSIGITFKKKAFCICAALIFCAVLILFLLSPVYVSYYDYSAWNFLSEPLGLYFYHRFAIGLGIDPIWFSFLSIFYLLLAAGLYYLQKQMEKR